MIPSQSLTTLETLNPLPLAAPLGMIPGQSLTGGLPGAPPGTDPAAADAAPSETPDPLFDLPGLFEALTLMDAAVSQNTYFEKLLLYRNITSDAASSSMQAMASQALVGDLEEAAAAVHDLGARSAHPSRQASRVGSPSNSNDGRRWVGWGWGGAGRLVGWWAGRSPLFGVGRATSIPTPIPLHTSQIKMITLFVLWGWKAC